VCKVVCAVYGLVARCAHIVLVEVGVDERCFPFAASSVDVNGEGGCSTCALGRLDVSELDALGLHGRPVEVALKVGDVASLRVCSLHERRLTLAIRSRCASYAERQRQSYQGDFSEERSHGEKMLRGYLTATVLFMQMAISILPRTWGTLNICGSSTIRQYATDRMVTGSVRHNWSRTPSSPFQTVHQCATDKVVTSSVRHRQANWSRTPSSPFQTSRI
jgi:hypothetical protein